MRAPGDLAEIDVASSTVVCIQPPQHCDVNDDHVAICAADTRSILAFCSDGVRRGGGLSSGQPPRRLMTS